MAKTEQGTLINVEVQVANKYDIDKRTMFYWAGLYHGQLTSGQKFSDLRKTITINILGFYWFPDEQRYHNTFQIRKKETGQLLNDDLEIHFLELEKIKKLSRKPKDALESWLMYLHNLGGEEMEAIAMANPCIRKALTIEETFWQSKKERRMYELREKALRDEISAIAGAKAEGELRKAMETARAALKEGLAVEIICKITGLNEEIVQKLKNELNYVRFCIADLVTRRKGNLLAQPRGAITRSLVRLPLSYPFSIQNRSKCSSIYASNS